jgi:homoserine dehydrogenase
MLNVALLGFGNVGRALAELLMQKQDALRAEFKIVVRVVGISTGRHGQAIDEAGISLRTALDAVRYGATIEGLHRGNEIKNQTEFLRDVPADLVFESVPTNPHDGQPALDYTRFLLGRGVHVVSANKGPVVHAYRELTALAADHGVGYFFESSVMDGAPIFSVAREGLPAATITKVSGIFNSTTNYILTRMEEEGLTFDQAVHEAQKIGIAETDPALDVDGWDASIKTAILANVLMGASLKPSDVDREGIRDITPEDIRQAAAAGQRIKLLCEAVRAEDGTVSASVQPSRVALSDPLAGVSGTSSVVDFYTDVLPRLTIVENDPGPVTTAYGMLADMVNIVRKRYPLTGDEEKSLDEG